MKKILAVLLAIILVMTMAACNKAPSEQDNTTAAAGSSSAETTEDNSTTGRNNPTEGGNGTTVGTETTDPTGSGTAATTQGTTEPTGGTTTPTTLPTDETTTPTTPPTGGNTNTEPTKPPAGATDVTEPTHTHEYDSKVTKATCTTDGYTTHTCACGNTYTDSTTKATGHKFGEWKTTKEPTTTATGEAERKCANCSEKETKTLGKLTENHKHSYTSKVTKAATCSTEGVKTYTCSCGDTYTESIAKTAHNYSATVTKPTCTTDGYTTYKCSCGTSYNGAKTNALGHNYKDSVTKPTCEDGGYTTHTCERCGIFYVDTRTNATGHNYYVSSDTKATCTSDGKKMETCRNCGDNKTVATYPATGHQHTRKEETNSTCSTKGYVKTICTDCGQTVSATEKALLPHSYSKEMILSDAVKALQSNGNNDYGRWIAYSEWKADVCTNCGVPNMDSMRYAYTEMEAAQIMLGYVNDLRAEVYGSHEYDMQVNEHLMGIAAIRAKELVTNYSHNTTTEKYGAGENISHDNLATPIKTLFNNWKNSPGHYANMIDTNYEFFAYAAYLDGDGYWYSTGSSYGVQLFWDWYELYEYERIHGLL